MLSIDDYIDVSTMSTPQGFRDMVHKQSKKVERIPQHELQDNDDEWDSISTDSDVYPDAHVVMTYDWW